MTESTADEIVLDNMSQKFPMWKHQTEGVLKAIKQDSFAFFFEAGTGKTLTALNTYRLRCWNDNKRLRLLILCPLSVVQNWASEIDKFTNEPESKVLPLDAGSVSKRNTKLSNWIKNVGEGGIVITNYDSLLNIDYVNMLHMEFQPEMIIFDESHRIKTPTAIRAKNCQHLAKSAKYKLLLTGTPSTKDEMDYFGQFLVMDGGKTLGANMTAFKNRYFKKIILPFKVKMRNGQMINPRSWVMRESKNLDFLEAVASKSMYVAKDDCLDLPPLIRSTKTVAMTDHQAEVYGQLQRDAIAFLDGAKVETPMAITKTLRLLQVCSGHLPMPDGRVHDFAENNKKEALKDLLQEFLSNPHRKVLVWACFKHNYKEIRSVCEGLKVPYVELHGETPSGKRQANIDEFNKGKARVLIGHPASGGIGVNLTASDTSIYYSRDFSLENRLQSEARNYRGGSEVHKSVTHVDLVCAGTIEGNLVKLVQRKEKVTTAILKALLQANDNNNNKEEQK